MTTRLQKIIKRSDSWYLGSKLRFQDLLDDFEFDHEDAPIVLSEAIRHIHADPSKLWLLESLLAFGLDPNVELDGAQNALQFAVSIGCQEATDFLAQFETRQDHDEGVDPVRRIPR